MIATLTRLIHGTLKSRTTRRRRTPSIKELQAIRIALLDCVQDCESVTAQRLRHKIMHAQTVQELWLLRNDAFQLISQQTSQAVAAERINALIANFEGWLDPRQLVRIK